MPTQSISITLNGIYLHASFCLHENPKLAIMKRYIIYLISFFLFSSTNIFARTAFTIGEPPIAACMDLMVDADENCQVDIDATEFDGGSTDADGDPLTFTANPAAPYALGVTDLTISVSDGEFSDECAATITVVDNTPPLLLCDKPGPMFCTEVVPDADFLIDNGFVQAIDACDPNPTIVVLGPEEAMFGCFTTLTYQFYAIDVYGNISDTCSVVTQFLMDDGDPEISCSNPDDLGCNPAVKPTPQSLIDDGFVIATDGCGQVAIGALPLRDTTVTECDTIVSFYFKASDFCNNQSEICTVQVTWRVNTPIVLECPENLIIECDATDTEAQITAWLMDVIVSDACNDEILTDTYDPDNFTETCASESFQDVTFEVTDDCGDVASCVRRIEIVDTSAPEITCPDDITIGADKFFCEKADLDTGVPTVTDNCDEPFTTSVIRSDGLDLLDPYPLGTTIITWTVTGECSEMSSSCTQTITVIDEEAPTVICKTKIFVAVNANEGKVIVPDSFLYEGVFDNCSMEEITVTVSKNIFNCMDFDTAMVDVCAIDGFGNEKCCEVLVILQDNFDPIAECKDITVTLVDGEATITPEDIDNGSSDNTEECGLFFDLSLSQFSVGGVYQVILTVTDVSGNEGICTGQVTVKDDPNNPIVYLSTNVLLQGPLNDSESGMIPGINDVIPSAQPYNVAPWNYSGVEFFPIMMPNVVDWVLLELRDENNPTIVISSRAAFVLTNGVVLDLNGSNEIAFSGVVDGNYFLSVQHRNHLRVISSSPVTFISGLGTFDFTTGNVQGTNAMLAIANGKFAMWAGDTNGDGKINPTDRSNTFNDRNMTGYLTSDVNLDGSVNAADRSITYNNRNKVASF